MATFKNTSGHTKDIPSYKDQYGLDVHVRDGETIEILPEDVPQFEANPDWTASRTQSPTVTVDADATIDAAPAPAVTPPVDAAPTSTN